MKNLIHSIVKGNLRVAFLQVVCEWELLLDVTVNNVFCDKVTAATQYCPNRRRRYGRYKIGTR